MAITSIHLSPAFSREHARVLIRYLTTPNALTRAERQTLLQAVDALRDSHLTESDHTYTFTEFYATFVDAMYADEFLEVAWQAEEVEVIGRQRQAEVVRAIRQQFQQQGWYQAGDENSRVLLAFCLYWWTSFAIGYTFEVAILRDLTQSDIIFRAHDPRQRAERYAPSDPVIGAWTGDVKSSAYFFLTARSASLPHDFYVSRYYARLFVNVVAWSF
jgi:glutathione S-transferase